MKCKVHKAYCKSVAFNRSSYEDLMLPNSFCRKTDLKSSA